MSIRLLLPLLLLLPLTAGAETLAFPEAGFSFEPPPGWVASPPEKGGEGEWRRLFGPPGRPTPLTLPYLVIRQARAAPPTLESLEKLPRLPTAAREGDGPPSPLPHLGEPGSLLYDAKGGGIVWSKLSFSLPGKGRVAGLSGSLPTQTGLLQAAAYGWEADFKRLAPIFEASIRSVALDPGVGYRPGGMQRGLMVTMLPLVIIVLVLYLARRRRKFCKHGLQRRHAESHPAPKRKN